MFQWPPPDDASGGGGPQVNKFEQVSSVGHEMSVVGGWDQGVPGLMPRGVAGGAGFGVVSGLVSGREGIQ